MVISNRKDEHIKYAKQLNIKSNDFDDIKIDHDSLPDFDLDEINLNADFLGFNIPYPFYINAMTGGSEKAYEINQKLAYYANHFNIPMVLGSQSAALKDETLVNSYQIVRKINPNGIVIANLNLNYPSEAALKAIEMVNADGLSLHLNPIQELIMAEGDRSFKVWHENLIDILINVKKPILVKEVGFGMSEKTIEKLLNYGVEFIDVSGTGGTNFAQIERFRNASDNTTFDDLGISTVESIKNARKLTNQFYASGGIRNANDIFKALYLGASAVGLSKFFLTLTSLSNVEAICKIQELIDDLKKLFLIYGFKDIAAIRNRGN